MIIIKHLQINQIFALKSYYAIQQINQTFSF